MNTARLTLRARRRAERLMHDECEIRRPATLGELDEDTGERESVEGDLIYDGKCRIFTYEPFESTPKSGEHVFTVQRKQVHIPVDVEDVKVGDVVTITAASLDQALEGQQFRVAGTHHVSFARDQRLLVDYITA